VGFVTLLRSGENTTPVEIVTFGDPDLIKRRADQNLVYVQEYALEQFASYQEEALSLAKARASAMIELEESAKTLHETTGWHASTTNSGQIFVDYGYYSTDGEKHLRYSYDPSTAVLTPW
jgi:hypothetical protein